MKIAMIGHKRIPSREGGIEVVVETLATRMIPRNHEVTVYNRRGHHVSGKQFNNAHRTEYQGVQIKEVYTIDVKGLAAVTSAFFASLCVSFSHFDVIHYHAEGPCAMLWLPHLFGKRTVVTVHGLDWKRAKWKGSFASYFIKFGEKVAVKYADEIIVLSSNVHDYFWQTYHRETNFIPNGVVRPEILPADLITQTYGLKKDSYFLYLGRLVPEKGIHYLIRAFKGIATDKKLVIAGSTSDTDAYYKELVTLANHDPRILFTGFVKGQMLTELYSNCYVYVLPSDLEGMPLSLLEAMSYGNCCLVSDIPECANVVCGHGLLFQQGNSDDLASSLVQLEENEVLVRTYKQTAALYICQRYDWDEIVEQTLSLYEPNAESRKWYREDIVCQ
jgi:glycosyltransferase involved in cell wall biosynthesis